MRAKRALNGVLFAFAVTAGLGSVAAQGVPSPKDPELDPAAKRQELAMLLARYKALPPERRRELRKLYVEKLQPRSKAERRRLRRQARARWRRERAAKHQRDRLAKQRKRFAHLDAQRKRRFRRLLRRLIHDLPADERRELAMLPQEQRQRRIRQMIKEYREGEILRRINNLPASVRSEIDAHTEGLEGGARFREVRKQVHAFVKRRALTILRDPQLSPAQKQRRLRAMLQRYIPRERWREQLMRRFRRHLQKQRGKGAKRGKRDDVRRRARERARRRKLRQQQERDRPLRPNRRQRRRAGKTLRQRP